MLRNFVEETVSAPGTATTINLGGATTGRVGFIAALGSGASSFYFLDDGTQAEWGYGSATSGSPNTYERTTVLGNTAGTTARLNFTGATTIYGAVPAERMMYLAAASAGPQGIVSPLIDSRIYTYTQAQNLNTQIPLDDTIPASTEGDQIISQAWTPRSAANRIRLTFFGSGATSVAAQWTAALFAGTTCLAAKTTSVYVGNATADLTLMHEYVPGVTTPITFAVRVGIDRSGNLTLNGLPGPTGYFSTASRAATLLIEEFAA